MGLIEERRFAAWTNLATKLKTFQGIATQQPEVESLCRAMTPVPAVPRGADD